MSVLKQMMSKTIEMQAQKAAQNQVPLYGQNASQEYPSFTSKKEPESREEVKPAEKGSASELLNFITKVVDQNRASAGTASQTKREGDLSNLINLGESLRPAKPWLSVNQLEYYSIYPKQIKKWVTFTRTPKGFYDTNGRWVSQGDNFSELSFNRVEDQQGRRRLEAIYEEEQQKLPEHLRGRFRYGIQYDEIKDLGPKVKRLFSFTTATQKEIRKEEKRQAIIKWRRHENDTASDAIQVDILTQKVRALMKHLHKNKQDKRNQRSLQLLVKRRRGMMKYLKKRDVHTYFSVLREAKLKDLYQVFNFNVK